MRSAQARPRGQIARPFAVYLYQGGADETVPANHVDLNAKAIPQAVVRKLLRRAPPSADNDMSEVAADIRELSKGNPSPE
jgi:hypothetical protein